MMTRSSISGACAIALIAGSTSSALIPCQNSTFFWKSVVMDKYLLDIFLIVKIAYR